MEGGGVSVCEEMLSVMEGCVGVWVRLLSRELTTCVEGVRAGGEREQLCSEMCLLLDGPSVGGDRKGWEVRDGVASLC